MTVSPGVQRWVLIACGILAALVMFAAPRSAPAIPSGPRTMTETAPELTGAPLETSGVASSSGSAGVSSPAPASPSGGIGDPASYFKPTPRPRTVSRGTSDGIAKWYPRTRGYGDLATVALPDGHYIPYGRPVPFAVVCVFVEGTSRCLTLPVVDCLCIHANPRQVVDLSLGAVRAFGLDPLTGVWPASVERLP